MESSELSTLDEIRQFLVSKWGDLKPRLSIICGSGWGNRGCFAICSSIELPRNSRNERYNRRGTCG